MDIEKRLEYLISKRAELQASILRLKNECVSIQRNQSEKETKTIEEVSEFSDKDILSLYKNQKNKKINIRLGEGVIFESKLNQNEHTYIYFNQQISLQHLADGNTLSVRLNGKTYSEISPLIVFYDNNHKKILHKFFVLNIPMKFDVPENAKYISIGIRFLGECRLVLNSLLFHVSTLQDIADIGFVKRIQNKIDQIQVSNGCRYYEKYQGRFGIIADQFLYDVYKDTAECIYITPDNFQSVTIDFLIVASAWHGLNNEWDGITNPDSITGKKIYDVITYFRQQHIPVVFYSKEDPPNYEHFVGIAKECDYIFTSATEIIDRYKHDCSTDKVDSLCFAINPRLHNPVGIHSVKPEDGIIFSGSWMTKYPDRIMKLEMIFDGILKANKKLKIIDRNYEKNDPRYYFPEKYYAYVSPAIEHDVLQKVHKLYHWAVNINSVTESSTMFANRVYELQAIGNLLLSNYSKGVSEKFDGVHIVESVEDIIQILSETDEETLYYERIKNVRRVMTGETAYDRMNQIILAIGKDVLPLSRKVAVIIPKRIERFIEEFKKQSYSDKILLTESEFDEEHLKDVAVVAFWSDFFHYGRFYLEDMLNGFKYTECSYITKQSYIIGDEGKICFGMEHQYVDAYSSKYASVFWKDDFSIEELLALPEKGTLKNGYSIDHFELRKGENGS